MDNISIKVEVPECVDETVKAATLKPATTIGTTIADLIYLVFGPISHVADKRRIKEAAALENLKDELEKKEQKIPPSEKKEADFQIAGQALQIVRFCIEYDAIREFFENLIIASVDKRKEEYVHPSFVQIVSHLNSYDAKVLSDIYSKDKLPTNCLHFSLRHIKKSLDILEKHGLININKDEYIRMFTEEKRKYLDEKTTMVRIENWQNFLENEAEKYGTFSVSFQQDYVVVEPYEVIFTNDLNKTMNCLDARFFKSYFQLTEIGKDFCKVCIEE